MKLLSFRLAGDAAPRTGALLGRQVLDLTAFCADLPVPAQAVVELAQRGLMAAPGGLLRVLQAGEGGMAAVRAEVARHQPAGALPQPASRQSTLLPIDSVQLLAPVPRPGKVVAIGRNYGDHAAESGIAAFEVPRLIAKLASSVVGPHDTIHPPREVAKLDFEVELAVVIGGFGRRVPRERALDLVAGYCVLDDLSAREFQFDVSPPQTTFAKSMDQFCPMGPWLVTRDEIADPQSLDLSCEVNGMVMQSANTRDMLFPVDRLIEYITQFMTLEPGDVIATGTPAGVGVFRKPPVWLREGDVIRMTVAGIGTIEHRIGAPA